ncbi:MAG TPA: glycosyltransferase family 1 protein [Deltaproteobacteria bacterium]|nr:glycosyltransferase family 1 protein [Deltaproteobacteria bacterium]
MLRVCLALPVFYPTFAGGSLRFLHYQPGLRKRDIQARVLTGTARPRDDLHPGARPTPESPIGTRLAVDQIDGIPVHRIQLPERTGPRRTSVFFRALIELCQNPATRPDLIQLHSFERLESLYWIPRLARLGVPIVYAIQIAKPLSRVSWPLRAQKRRMLRRFYSGFDGIVTSSETIESALRCLGIRTPIAVIPNGVDLGRFAPRSEEERGSARRRLGLEPDCPVLLSVGAISPRKGADLLVEAWTEVLERHPTTRLLLVGPRHDRNHPRLARFRARLESSIRRSGRPDQVHLLGIREDLPDLYAASDLVVLPSAREGGTPNVMLEAMACGRPVLASPFEGQSKALGRPGIEFEQCRRTPAALARSIDPLLADPARRRRLAKAGRSWVVRHLDLETSLDRFAGFYRGIDDWKRATGACPFPGTDPFETRVTPAAWPPR